MQIEEAKLHALLGLMINERRVAQNPSLAILGDELGLYRASAEQGPVSPDELAAATGTYKRLVREWLSAQAASGFVTCDADTRRFSLLPEQAAVLADDDSVVNMVGGFHALLAGYAAALGAQAGQMRLEAVLREGRLPQVRRAADTPFNMVLEAGR